MTLLGLNIKIRVMRIELENELEPMNMIQRDFFWKARIKLDENEGKILPVYIKGFEANEERGNFFIRLVAENGVVYLQAEDFSSSELARNFTSKYSARAWKEIQPNIYRLKTTDINW